MDTREQPDTNDSFSTIALIERNPSAQGRPKLLGWWYRIAAPPTPPASASLREREAYRRGKYISHTLLGIIVIVLAMIVIIFTQLYVVAESSNHAQIPNLTYHALLPNLIVTLLILCGAVFFNKRGQVIVSGIIVVLVLDGSIMSTTLGYPKMTAFLLPLLDVLVIPELFAASLLPPRFVFFDMIFHIAFIVCALTFLSPQDQELIAIFHSAYVGDALARPIIIQAIAAVISFTWMRSVILNVERADRATSIALLERNIAEQSQLEAEQKRRLESEIQEIIETHRQISNGNFNVRVPLLQGNTLWPVAGSLNNLLARFQSLRQESERLQLLDKAMVYYFEARNKAQDGPIPWQPTGTAIDLLVQQHNTFSRLTRQQQER